MGDRRLRQTHSHSHQSDENCSLKPLHEQPATSSSSSSSTMVPSASQQNPEPSATIPISEFITKPPTSPRNQQNSKWVSRNRRDCVVKSHNGKKSDVVPLNSCEVEVEEEEEETYRGMNELSYLDYFELENVHKEEEEKKNGLVLNKDFGREKIENNCSLPEKDVDDIASRLEELRLGEKEQKLSEDILRINDQLQEDELVAMESIYGDNIFILDKQSGLRSFQVHVHIESPTDLTISTQLHSSSDIETKHDEPPEFNLYSFKVKYLPPIVLTCLLPRSYPSHLPPHFTISVQWLDTSRISNLCCMLDSIWKEQPGQEVIYQWVEWLQSSSLSYVGFDEVIILSPYGMSHTEDKRAIS